MWLANLRPWLGLKGHFHFAEKKGYSGVAVYTKHEPSEVVVGMGS
jgi:exodeoxyribonuclease III